MATLSEYFEILGFKLTSEGVVIPCKDASRYNTDYILQFNEATNQLSVLKKENDCYIKYPVSLKFAGIVLESFIENHNKNLDSIRLSTQAGLLAKHIYETLMSCSEKNPRLLAETEKLSKTQSEVLQQQFITSRPSRNGNFQRQKNNCHKAGCSTNIPPRTK